MSGTNALPAAELEKSEWQAEATQSTTSSVSGEVDENPGDGVDEAYERKSHLSMSRPYPRSSIFGTVDLPFVQSTNASRTRLALVDTSGSSSFSPALVG
jgi:hypothetical protein